MVTQLVSLNLNRLAGRNDEIALLRRAYERAFDKKQHLQELCVIRGASGTGKTVLAKTLQDVVTEESAGKGYFIAGKFQISSVQHPYALFVSCFNQLVESLQERQIQAMRGHVSLDILRQTIRQELGNDGTLLTKVFPSLEALIVGSPMDENYDLKSIDTLKRFQFAFVKLFRLISTLYPVVLFVDDLQWGDKATLDLLEALLLSRHGFSGSQLLLIVAVRDEHASNDVDVHSPGAFKFNFASTMENYRIWAQAEQIKLTTICLHNLDKDATNSMIADFLGKEPTTTVPLGQLVFSCCRGNPYTSLQVLNALISQGTIYRDAASGQWEWNDDDVLPSCRLEHTIGDLMIRKLSMLPELSQKVLQVAACMGDEVDVCAVAIVLETGLPDVEASLKEALKEDLMLLNCGQGSIRFSHDRVRQAILSMIPDQETLSFSIGRKLRLCSTVLYMSTKMFLIATLLNNGVKIMTDPEERCRAAAFSLEAGIKAASLAAFPDSCRYLNAGIEFLKGTGHYWNDQYDLSLKLFSVAADSELCTQNFDRAMLLADEVTHHAKSVHDMLSAEVVKINTLGQTGKTEQAIETGLDVLEKLGEPLPRKITKAAVVYEVVKAKLSLRGRSDYDILMLKRMESKDKIAAMHVLAVLMGYTFMVGNISTALIGTRLVRLTLKHGLNKLSAMGFSTLAFVVSGRDRDEGYRLGMLALQMVETSRARELTARVHTLVYGLVQHWKRPLRDSLEPLRLAAKVGIDTGDVEYALAALYFRSNHCLACRHSASEAETFLEETKEQIIRYKQEIGLDLIKPLLQYLRSLMGRAPEPSILVGDVVGPNDAPSKDGPVSVQLSYSICGALLAYEFGNLALAHELSEKIRDVPYEPLGVFSLASSTFVQFLVAIARARLGMDRKKSVKIARRGLKKMRAWASSCPENFLCRQYILEAEMKSLKPSKGVNDGIKGLFDAAIRHAQEVEFTGMAAQASELAGDYLSRQGDHSTARVYWRKARSLHLEWGATGKADHLTSTRQIGQLDTK